MKSSRLRAILSGDFNIHNPPCWTPCRAHCHRGDYKKSLDCVLGSNLYPRLCLYFTKVSICPQAFFENEKNIYTATQLIDDWRLLIGIHKPHPVSLLIGIYNVYESWSTEGFRKNESKKRAAMIAPLSKVPGFPNQLTAYRCLQDVSQKEM